MFTPFELADIEKKQRSFPIQRLLPIKLEAIDIVPQLISSNAEQFVSTAQLLFNEGFTEVNLNMGCPSAGVASKNRGAGMLQNPAATEKFLSHVNEKLPGKISLKIRSGIRYHEELRQMTEIYNKFSFKEIILHPRTMEQQYEGKADTDVFKIFSQNSTNKTVYNGDILTVADFEFIDEIFHPSEIMIGRGLLANPFLAEEIQHKHELPVSEKLSRLKNFISEIMDNYSNSLSGDSHFLDKMKEFWTYQSRIFTEEKKILKKLRKVHSKKNMYCMTEEIFSSDPEIKNGRGLTIQNQYPEFR